MNDVVYMAGLEVETLIGVYDFERLEKQKLYLDIELSFDCMKAGETDDLSDALDYDRLARMIRKWSLAQTFALLEAYAEALCQLIHKEFDISRVGLKINKPAAVNGCAAVGIRIERQF